MRRFFGFIFATVGVIAILIAALVVLAFVYLSPGEPDLPQRFVLRYDLNAPPLEGRNPDALAELLQGRRANLFEITDSLARAADDPRVDGLLLRLRTGAVGMANIEELRDALKSFRASGKFVIVFSESFGEMQGATAAYTLATAGDEIWMQPTGDLGTIGIASQRLFLRDMFAEIGVEPQFAKRYEYKTAPDMFTKSSMTPADRRQTDALLDSLYDGMVGTIAEARGIEPARVRDYIDQAPLEAEAALGAGLIDRLGYFDEVLARIDERTGRDSKIVRIDDYVTAAGPLNNEGETVAVIYGIGPIVLGGGDVPVWSDEAIMGSERVAEAFRKATDDPGVRAIVFRVVSPGGSYVASDVIRREIELSRKAGIPVVVSMGNVAASGGYFVSIAANRIIAQPASLTGSIGVFGGKFVIEDLLREIGVTVESLKRGDQATMYNPAEKFTPEQWARFNASLDRIYTDFTRRVAAARGMEEKQVHEVAKGRVWSGTDAKQAGLVDDLGGMELALAYAKAEVGIEPEATVNAVTFPREKDLFTRLLENGYGVRSREAAQLARLARLLAPLAGALERSGLLEATEPPRGALQTPSEALPEAR
jgi:protease-4